MWKKIVCAVWIAIIIAAGTGRVAKAYPKHYLDYEAGIAAFFQFTGPTNLHSNLLRNLFRTIQTDAEGYLIGFVPAAGFESYPVMDAKVFVHNSGWVVAYYLADDRPSSMIFDKFIGDPTRLEKALASIAAAIEVGPYQVQWADFCYPEATKMLLIEANSASPATVFDFRLPGSNTYYERSWYIYAPGIFSSVDFHLDGVRIVHIQNGLSLAAIPAANLVPDAKHIVSLQSGLSAGYFGLAILYSGSGLITVNYAGGLHQVDLSPIPQGLSDAAADVMSFSPTFLSFIAR